VAHSLQRPNPIQIAADGVLRKQPHATGKKTAMEAIPKSREWIYRASTFACAALLLISLLSF
jgi:hypothetical protein